jgi:hypothetical protein
LYKLIKMSLLENREACGNYRKGLIEIRDGIPSCFSISDVCLAILLPVDFD